MSDGAFDSLVFDSGVFDVESGGTTIDVGVSTSATQSVSVSTTPYDFSVSTSAYEIGVS